MTTNGNIPRRILENEIEEQTTELRGTIEQITAALSANNHALEDTTTQRNARVRELGSTLLPNLERATIVALENRLPGVVTATMVADARTQAERTLRGQIERLKAHFDPATYTTLRGQKDADRAARLEDLRGAESAFQDLRDVPMVESLIERHYGTGLYQERWWNWQYYTDWKAADEAVDQAKMVDWDALRRTYANMQRDVAEQRASIKGLELDIAGLDAKHRELEELEASLAQVPNRVLDDVRTKLSAHLNNLDPVPSWMKDIAALNTRAAALQEERTNLQTTKNGLLQAVGQLQAFGTKVQRSRKKNVPSSYLEALRSNRPARSSGGRVRSGSSFMQPSHTFNVTYVNDGYGYNSYNSGFFDGVLWGEMDSYFNAPSAPSYGGSPSYQVDYNRRDDGYSRDNYASSGVDYSRQS